LQTKKETKNKNPNSSLGPISNPSLSLGSMCPTKLFSTLRIVWQHLHTHEKNQILKSNLRSNLSPIWDPSLSLSLSFSCVKNACSQEEQNKIIIKSNQRKHIRLSWKCLGIILGTLELFSSSPSYTHNSTKKVKWGFKPFYILPKP
jgi:hypothetical protein